MIIREATIFDHSALVRSIFDQINDRVLNYPPPNKAIAVWVTNIMLNGVVIVAEEDGVIIGTIGIGFTHFPWNDEVWIARNEWLHVDKNHRKGGVASKLIDRVKEICKERNLIAIFGIINDKDIDKIGRFIAMKGFRHMGNNFAYNLGEL